MEVLLVDSFAFGTLEVLHLVQSQQRVVSQVVVALQKIQSILACTQLPLQSDQRTGILVVVF